MKIMTNSMHTGLAAACAPVALSAVAPFAARVALGAPAVASLLVAAKPSTLGRVQTSLMAKSKIRENQGSYASKPEAISTDGLRGVPPRGRPVI